MRVLVTGGAGFIASHVSDRLLDRGFDVAIVDNLATGKRENIPAGARFHEVDVRDARLAEVFEAERPDIVIHHAAQMDVRKSVTDPRYDADVNLLGTLNLLECCRVHGTRKVVYAGTGGAMFGEAAYLPVDEKHPVQPISPYGVSKHTVEHYLYAYRANFGLDYTVLRYPNVYGPRQDPHGEAGVVAIFSLQLLNGETPRIFGDGTKTRDYCYVGDIVEANMLAIERGSDGLFNIGRGIEVSDRQVFESVRDAVGVDIEPEYAPTRPGEVEHIALDATLARETLGWEWKVDLAEGVGRAVDFYKERRKRV
ncbi:MAG TPA: NAD-dependent epimerase/dehydratase family protein [Thermoleophilia bacterium]|nr:NAD-dependent epimerase/dehydratase family protein [Thermoleophilia bacterium]